MITRLRLFAYASSTPLRWKTASSFDRPLTKTRGWLVGPGWIVMVSLPLGAAVAPDGPAEYPFILFEIYNRD